MLVSVRSSVTSVERLDTSQGTARRRMLPLVLTLSLFGLVMIMDAEPKGPNVVTGTLLLNNRYTSILFDSGFDRSFVNTRFSSLLDIKPTKIMDIYEVELADRRLGTFDVIIDMDWLVKHDAIIVCGKKVVHIPYGNKTLIVKGDKGVSRLRVISCIKAQDVPVIRDFPEVFPEELPGLPPSRQVEF
ncbi:hypothetical protein Tco_1458224 [Tanacetum coccineum]